MAFQFLLKLKTNFLSFVFIFEYNLFLTFKNIVSKVPVRRTRVKFFLKARKLTFIISFRGLKKLKRQ